jgi:hypothetical protein
MSAEVLKAIIELFETDSGSPFQQADIEEADFLWDQLSKEGKDFLINLSREDLTNVVIGEVRQQGNIEVCLFNGGWKEVPAEVSGFLNYVFEGAPR